jgi:hypothetical protein
MIQHILVCAQDSVLAKKVRYLLAGDNCEVEILSKPSQLEKRLREGSISLLILSRMLDGEDAIEMIARFDPVLIIPPTIVLGGQPTITADFITVIPDPVDTQAIYRIASEALAYQVVNQEVAGISDEELTHLGIERPSANATIPMQHAGFSDEPRGRGTVPDYTATSIDESRAHRDDDISFTDVTGLDEIAGRLDLLESADAMLNDAFDVDEGTPQGQKAQPPSRRGGHRQPEPPVLGGLLEPARFAKVLYQCWSKNATGALIVARDHENLTIHFENGSPVYVESSIPGDQLGRSLVNRGRITEAQYSDGAKRAIERGLRLGQALVELAFFTNSELGRELGTTAREQIVGCFASRQGAFEFDAKRKVPTDERPYSIAVGHIISEGIKAHADESVLREIIGDIDPKYFKLTRTPDELQKRFPLDQKDLGFLDFSGRAYNVADASEVSGLDIFSAHKLMALLITCEDVQDFTPGVKEFESRINEERQRTREMESRRPAPVSLTPEPALPPVKKNEPPPVPATEKRNEPVKNRFIDELPRVSRNPFGGTPGSSSVSGTSEELPGMRKPAPFETIPPPPPMNSPPPPLPQPSTSSHGANTNGDVAVPPMPVPANNEGSVPRPLVYAKPLPRGPDGAPLETSERTLSREHFQRGVTLLGQGNFASAEEAFRDAVALCSEEHVYLIGLARAIYYNPGYRADGKVPVLKAIVGRAEQLAPDDNRVATLSTWINSAENQLRA